MKSRIISLSIVVLLGLSGCAGVIGENKGHLTEGRGLGVEIGTPRDEAHQILKQNGYATAFTSRTCESEAIPTFSCQPGDTVDSTIYARGLGNGSVHLLIRDDKVASISWAGHHLPII